jgi:hypothetical protein
VLIFVEAETTGISIRTSQRRWYLSLLAVAILLLVLPSPQTVKEPIEGPQGAEYWPSTLCRDCHDKIFDQHLESMHAKSFTNPAFKAQYFDEILPQVQQDPTLQGEAEMCIACHSPIAYTENQGLVELEEQIDPLMSGVTCDFCHTLPGYKGERPENANYITEPGEKKLGPFPHEYDWHHVYSEFVTKSEFCAVCHNYVNQNGLEIRSTYSEWKTSRYAEEGIECQDCHMSVDGFLTAGEATYESGRAATMTLGSAPFRGRLYTHRFPGAHSRSQVVGALTLAIETDKDAVDPGDEVEIRVLVDNSRTGHKMPSGSPELRLLLLDLRAHYGGLSVPIPITPSKESESCGVSGYSQCKGQILEDEMLPGSRVYRALYADSGGSRTLASYHAAEILFDNRINATEIRKETYKFVIPENAEGLLTLTAKLFYLSYPRSFSESLGLGVQEPVEIATGNKELVVR